ncbi:gliding motility-associated C-terminal domain-containing protein, partial [Flavobacterium piscinae]
IVVECDGTGNESDIEAWLASNGGATATDNCSDVTWTNDFNTLTNDCSTSITVIFTATDACGNTATTSATFAVQDSTAPVAPETPADVTVACASEVPATISLTATDNCAGEISAEGVDTTVAGDCPNSFVITRTWTFVDECGNETVISQTITVNDTIQPEITTEATSLVVECDGSGNQEAITAWINSNGGATATDNCSEVTWSNNFSELSNDCSTAITVIFTATDACGNTATTSATFAVQDNTAPVAPEAPAAVTVACASEVPATISLTATDNCAGEITVEGVDTTVAGDCPNSFVITRTWAFVDECGNETAISQTITVNDIVVPAFVEELPATELTVECDAIPAMATLTAIDNCGTASVVENVITEPGDCPGSYMIVRTWEATDECGNTATHQQMITVIDTTGPVASEFDSEITVNCDAIPEVPQLLFTDACSGIDDVNILFDEQITNESSASYTIVRTWIVGDNCGNNSEFTQTITVNIQDSLIRIDAESCIGDITTVNLDNLLPVGTTGGVWVDVNNTGALNGNIFSPSEVSSIGNYILQYEITQGDCPRVYEVTMNVNDDCLVFPCDAIEINNAFTPNGDALNEYFSIKNIENTECYTSNTVEIYNRWGVLVYEVENYNNNDRRFEGISEGRATLNKNAELPTGTYFYIINYTTVDGNVVNKSGYLYLTR